MTDFWIGFAVGAFFGSALLLILLKMATDWAKGRIKKRVLQRFEELKEEREGEANGS